MRRPGHRLINSTFVPLDGVTRNQPARPAVEKVRHGTAVRNGLPHPRDAVPTGRTRYRRDRKGGLP